MHGDTNKENDKDNDKHLRRGEGEGNIGHPLTMLFPALLVGT